MVVTCGGGGTKSVYRTTQGGVSTPPKIPNVLKPTVPGKELPELTGADRSGPLLIIVKTARPRVPGVITPLSSSTQPVRSAAAMTMDGSSKVHTKKCSSSGATAPYNLAFMGLAALQSCCERLGYYLTVGCENQKRLGREMLLFER
jgi:hypothetical protein